MSRAHRFLFAASRPNPDHPVHPAFPRDPEAVSQLEKALLAEGFLSGSTVLNYPGEERRFDWLPWDDLFKVNLPFLEEGDVLCQGTRPPISDYKEVHRRKIEPSNTDLERATFLHWLRYFDYCARTRVVLNSEVASLLPPGYRDREEMLFYQVGCRYKNLRERGRSLSSANRYGDRTAAFLLRVDEIFPGGPGFVAAWGLNALSTLAWCRLLREKYSYLLENRGLSMVELNPAKTPARPMTYEFTDDWDVEVLLETGVEMPPRPEEANFAISL